MTDDRLRSAVSGRRSIIVQASIYATVLVAFFLRVYRLADKNVWWDEGWSVWLSQQELAWIALRTAMDEHPPLHYWMLHFWNLVIGTDAFAGRFISVAFGVLTVALLYRIGKRVGARGVARHSEQSEESRCRENETLRSAQGDDSAWIGVLAALFLATARFHIWWSQDIKNYTPSIFFAFAAVWFALEILRPDRRINSETSENRLEPIAHQPDSSGLNSVRRRIHPMAGYALCAALALWTHYLAALVLLALNVYVVFVFMSPAVGSRRSAVMTWLAANALAAALFAPWMYLYLQNAAAWTAAPAFDFALFLKLVATVLPLGVTTNIDNYAALVLAFTALAALPVISKQLLVNSKQLLVNSKQSLSPVHRSLFTDYCSLFALIVLLPPLLVYVLSLTPISFFAPKIQARYLLILLPAYVMLLALGIASLSRLSRYLAFLATLFVLAANAFVLSDYYAERRLRDEYTTMANVINSFARQDDVVLLDTDQEWPAFLYHLRVRLDWMGAPNGKPMDEHTADLLTTRALSRYRAVWLVAIPDALATDPQRLLEARLAREVPKQFEQTFDDKRLVLYSATPRDLTSVPRGNFAPQHTRAEKVSDDLQLLGFDLPVREARAGDTVRVVTYWNARVASTAQTIPVPAGERVRVETDIFVPPNARGVLIALNAVELAYIPVETRPPLARVGEIANRVDYRFGEAIHLVGYDLPATRLRAGESVPITLYWRADRAIEKSHTVFVHIRGEQFNPKQNNPLWGQVDRAPSPPTNAWLPNEIVPDAYRVPIDASAPAGEYKIEIGLYDAATGARLAVEGGGDSVIVAEIEIR
jgi:uncharacterized membrane protein